MHTHRASSSFIASMFLLHAGLASFLFATQPDPSCRGCGAGKLLLQCDIYVAKQADLSKQELCERYAKIVDIDGASAKAAWYYLLAGKPEKARSAAKRAVDLGQLYAYEYLAFAQLISGKESAARASMQLWRKRVVEHAYLQKDLASLERLYPKVKFETLLSSP